MQTLTKTEQVKWKRHKKLRDHLINEELRRNPKLDPETLKRLVTSELNRNPETRSPLADTKTYRLQHAYEDWSLRGTEHYEVHGVLKLHSLSKFGSKNALSVAQDILKLYWNHVDRIYYPSRVIARGTRVQRIVFQHFGEGENLHYDFLAADPLRGTELYEEGQFISVLKNLWDDTSVYANTPDSEFIARYSDRVGSYPAHEVHKLGTDSFLTEVSHRAEPLSDIKDHINERLIRRLVAAEIGQPTSTHAKHTRYTKYWGNPSKLTYNWKDRIIDSEVRRLTQRLTS